MNQNAADRKLKILISGAGNRVFPKNQATSLFRGWFDTSRRSCHFEVVGVQDVSPESLARVTKDYPTLSGVPTFLKLEEALAKVACDTVLVSSEASAHATSALLALEANCHVLMEKPMVTRLADAFKLIGLGKKKGRVISIVQNWRSKSMGLALRDAVKSGKIGRVGNIFFRYVRNREHPHLPAYLFEEPYPLLYAMAIHHFDLFRFFLGENIVTVEGRGLTPPWSRYKSSPAVHLLMTSEKGVTISYAGTFSSKNNHVPQESLVVDGELGSLTNDSQWGEPPLLFSGGDEKTAVDLTAGVSRDIREQYNQADDHYLEDFYQAVISGRPPLCAADDNIWTLASIDAAVQACTTGRPVDVRQLLQSNMG